MIEQRKRPFRFYYHWNRIHKKISVHFLGSCYLTKGLNIQVDTEAKFNNTQPLFVMRGWANHIDHNNNRTIIK